MNREWNSGEPGDGQAFLDRDHAELGTTEEGRHAGPGFERHAWDEDRERGVLHKGANLRPDVAKANPTQEHYDMYRRIKDEVAGLGVEFPY